MSGKFKAGAIQRALLTALEASADLTVALLAAGTKATNIPKVYRRRKRAREQIRRSLWKLRDRKLVEIQWKGDEQHVTLTRAGKRQMFRWRFADLRLQPLGQWDGKWRIAIFDIPERHGKARRALAQKIKQMGAYGLQESVYVYPYSWENEIDFVAEFFQVTPYVRYIEALQIEGDQALKRHFGL